ncbi:putative membrane protein [Paramicrosporidium saccamoebae]|uniref:Putative membrane protein n=1 Tax=Paramicrosporidium saccamoebae TaxID=1246581 RepID=A0A2H9TK08_9FUNG|nr:putative membrane protein [Paramicrosporidium saccamoebae]
MMNNVVLTILLFTLLSAACGEFNGYRSLPEHPAVDTLVVDDEWKQFCFTTGHAPTRFEFRTTQFTFLEITDLYCKGDQFGIFDHESLLGSTGDADSNCTENGENPNDAVAGGWSTAKFFLPTGNHNVTVLVLKNPYKEGSAAIRLTSVTPILK